MDEKKPQRKMLTLVQKVQLYTWASKLHDSGKMKEMSYDQICQLGNEELAFPVNYGHMKSLLAETGWEVSKQRRNDRVSKSDLETQIKELEARLEDMQVVLTMKLDTAKYVSQDDKQWKDWVENIISSFDRRLKDIEKRMNMPASVPPASTIKIAPPQVGSGTAPTSNLYNKPGQYGKH